MFDSIRPVCNVHVFSKQCKQQIYCNAVVQHVAVLNVHGLYSPTPFQAKGTKSTSVWTHYPWLAKMGLYFTFWIHKMG